MRIWMDHLPPTIWGMPRLFSYSQEETGRGGGGGGGGGGLSMVSDASSGPPQLPPENGEKNHDSFFSYGFSTTPNSGKRRKVERERRQQHLQHHGGEFEHLDDTASSSYSTIPKENNHLIHVNGSPPHKGEEPFKSSYPSTLLKLTSATWQKKSTWENRYLSYYLTMLMSPNE